MSTPLKLTDLTWGQGVAYTVILSAGALSIWAWALQLCWGWLAVPEGLPALTLYQAATVHVLIEVTTYKRGPEPPELFRDACARDIVHNTVVPALFTATAGILYLVGGS